MSTSRIALIGLLTVVLLACAAPAFAAGPTKTPETLGSYTFTNTGSALPFTTASNALPGDQPSPAWWGWVKSRYRGTVPGALWCAGTPTRGLSATTLYPMGTRGTATLDATQTADLYSSSFKFYYSWPDYFPYRVSPYDADSFNVAWKVAGAPATQVDRNLPHQASLTAWSLKTENLSNPANGSVISRRASKLFFDFTDNVGTYGELPATNLGPAVDDVTISGFTYGPVRGIQAQVIRAPSYRVLLSWSRPASSTVDPSDDTRPKSYRVWREEIAVPGVLTEVAHKVDETSTVTSVLDSTAVGSKDYRYFVQAWDSTGLKHWGEVAAGFQFIPPRNKALLSATLPSVPRIVDYNGSTSIVAALTDSNGNPLSHEVLKLYTSTASSLGPWLVSSVTSKETTTGVYVLVPRTTTKTWYQIRSVTSTDYASAVSTGTLLIQSKAKLYTPSVPSVAYRSKSITISSLMLPRHTGTSYFRFYKRLYNFKTRTYYYSSSPSFSRLAKVTSSGSYSKIYLTLKMPYTGVWAVQTYHSDASHVPSVSSKSRGITVR